VLSVLGAILSFNVVHVDSVDIIVLCIKVNKQVEVDQRTKSRETREHLKSGETIKGGCPYLQIC